MTAQNDPLFPANTGRRTDAGLMLVHRLHGLRRCPSITPSSNPRLNLSGLLFKAVTSAILVLEYQ